MKMKVYATLHQEVSINVLSVLNDIHIIPQKDWIKEENGKLIQYTDSGYHGSWDEKVGEVSKEVYDAYVAKQTLIKFLEKKDEDEKRKKAIKDYEYYADKRKRD